MLELIAQGPAAEHRWRRQLPVDIPFELGRATRPWSVNWDNRISRRHMKMLLHDGKLVVEKLSDAANPIFFQGEEVQQLELEPGEHFVVGQTTFTLTQELAFVTQNVPNPISQKTFTADFLRTINYRDANRRIKVLNQLPDAISSAGNVEDLSMRIVNLLLSGIGSSTAVGIVRLVDEPDSAIEILQWDHQPSQPGDFEPSEGLIRQAIETHETVLHLWSSFEGQDSQFTVDYENDWAFVTPLHGNACSGWGIYVAGKNRRGSGGITDSGSDPIDLQGDIKFAELISSTLANVLQVQQLERRQSSLRPFFSPVVMQAFSDQDPEEVLAPRRCDVSVLFCDLRGFSSESEKMADNLLGLLSRVSGALGIMTRNIMDRSGVIGDFHGDAAMGFWGWPLKQPSNAVDACRAAMAIEREFAFIAQQPEHELSNFKIGIGIASGQAVAGKIGTSEQVKVTVFGPVVNLASRLEGLTKQFGSAILIDQETFDQLTTNSTEALDGFVARKLCRILPFGLKNATDLYELFPEEGNFDSQHLADYAEAVYQFEAGNWDLAAEKLSGCKNDPAADYLERWIRIHHGSPPDDWNGVIIAKSK